MKSVIRGSLQISGSIVTVNQKRTDEISHRKDIQIPIGLTKEQKRQFILEANKKDGNNSSN